MIDINANIRRSPYVQDSSWLNPTILKRAADIAIPFLNLYGPTAKIMGVGLGAVNSAVQLKGVYFAFRQGAWGECAKQMVATAFLVSMVVSTVLMPVVSVLATQGISICSHGYHIGQAIHQRDFSKVAGSLFQVASSVAYIASMIYLTPEWLLCSLVMQAGQEFYCSYKEYKQGRYAETLANVLLGGIRAYSSRDSFFTVKRNWLGDVLKQDGWDRYLEKASQKRLEGSLGVIDFEKYLIKDNVSSYIQGINAKSADLSKMNFKNLHFTKCDFSYASFDNSAFNKIRFDKCQMEQARFLHAVFSDTTFQKSFLKEADFYKSSSNKLRFQQIDLTHVTFNDSKHEKFEIDKGVLEGTCFLHAQMKDSLIKNANLTNCILADAKAQLRFVNCSKNVFTKPVVALTWSFNDRFHYAGEIRKALKEQDALVMPFEIFPEDVNIDLLGQEVDRKMALLDENTLQDFLSRGDYLASNLQKASVLEKLQKRAEAITRAVHGVVLSGGDDVEPIFYGGEFIPSDDKLDYRRTALEFMVMKQALAKNRALLGTCRGSQVTNVYLGGTLKTVGPQSGVKEFEYTSEDAVETIQNLLQDTRLWGFSAHHQAVEKLGDSLKIIAKDGDIPKLMVGHKNGSPIFLTQFHPEFYLGAARFKAEIDDRYQKLHAADEACENEEIQQALKYLEALRNNLSKVEMHKRFYEHFLAQIPQNSVIA